MDKIKVARELVRLAAAIAGQPFEVQVTFSEVKETEEVITVSAPDLRAAKEQVEAFVKANGGGVIGVRSKGWNQFGVLDVSSPRTSKKENTMRLS